MRDYGRKTRPSNDQGRACETCGVVRFPTVPGQAVGRQCRDCYRASLAENRATREARERAEKARQAGAQPLLPGVG